MKRPALLRLCAAGWGVQAQEPRRDPAPAPAPAAVVVQTPMADEVAVEYRAQAEGQALIEVAAPAGARVDVREGQALIGRATAPMTVKGQPDHWYAIAARP